MYIDTIAAALTRSAATRTASIQSNLWPFSSEISVRVESSQQARYDGHAGSTSWTVNCERHVFEQALARLDESQ